MDKGNGSTDLLHGYRALDLTDASGFLCGRLLSDLGVDVVKVEPPGGDPSRSTAPFYHDHQDPGKSLYCYSYNANKRGITLDVTHPEAKTIFNRLIRSYDIVIESFAPGFMKALGLGYEDLAHCNEALIMASITPFGQNGPYCDFKGTDLIISAMSGYMSLCGDPDRPPVRIGFPQSYLHASASAAGAVVTALYYRGMTGKGQYIDVAAQACFFDAAMDAPACWVAEGKNNIRVGANRIRPGTKYQAPAIFECKDGYIYFVMYGKKVGEKANRAIVQWMNTEGFATDFINNIDWQNFDPWDPQVDQAYMDGIMAPVQRFFKQHTKSELFETGLAKHIMLFPLCTTEDIASSAQLDQRQYWVDLNHADLDADIRYPGAFVKLPANPFFIRTRAPLPGEHNSAVYQEELGFSDAVIRQLQDRKVI
ncbi:MAG: hypothetical protein C4519_16065 [Desulfobacteraceae bacterium]|nr:MAG: hypothetical protein C4519_16065 [Desulfobacteraceae bacterium]